MPKSCPGLVLALDWAGAGGDMTGAGSLRAASTFYVPGPTRGNHRRTGSLSNKAEERRIHGVRSSRGVEAESSKWLRSSGEVWPGEIIAVSLGAERVRPLPPWASTATILHNMAVAPAAVHSV